MKSLGKYIVTKGTIKRSIIIIKRKGQIARLTLSTLIPAMEQETIIQIPMGDVNMPMARSRLTYEIF